MTKTPAEQAEAIARYNRAQALFGNGRFMVLRSDKEAAKRDIERFETKEEEEDV